MAHSVIIATPRPTWEETVQRLGLSKADQRFVTGLFEGKISRSNGTLYAFKSSGAAARSSKNGNGKVSALTGKTKSRARKTA